MRISYAITVCDELVEIQRLIKVLSENKRSQDEIVVLFDKGKGSPEVWSYIQTKEAQINKVNAATFKHHFADWKNKLTDNCNGDYIFQIDADEYLKKEFIKLLPAIIESNSNCDLFLVPRINTVEGLTQQHIDKWRWNVNDKGWVNFPDYQFRIWKNNAGIRWENKVHEVLKGYNQYVPLPADELYCLIHPKDIERQERQNNFYDTL